MSPALRAKGKDIFQVVLQSFQASKVHPELLHKIIFQLHVICIKIDQSMPPSRSLEFTLKLNME